MLIEKIPEEELKMIDQYRSRNISYCYDDFIPAKEILCEWDHAKSHHLHDLLDHQLILSKEIIYKYDENEIWSDINNLLDNSTFYINLHKFISKNYYTLPEPLRWDIPNLFNTNYLASNEYTGETFEITDPKNGKIHKIKNGMKTLRAISKIAEIFDIEGYEEFRIKHSQILNKKILKGNLTLSIHPLDYITMSDNNCGWSSCMSWIEEGCYRQGTVEMMNSPFVVVAYLTSEKPFSIGESEWNNKKWRQLFIITKDIIAGIKGYPYQNNDITFQVIEWLRELAQKNLGWTYAVPQRYIYNEDFHFQIENKQLYFETEYMYNDFRPEQDYLLAIGDECPEMVFTNYSGSSQCMICGKLTDNFSNEASLACCCCCDEDNGFYCDNCGCWVEDDPIVADGYELCEDCYNDCVQECDCCSRERYENNLTTIVILNDEDDSLEKELYLCASHYCGCLKKWQEENLKDDHTFRAPDGSSENYCYYQHYVYVSDLTDEARERLI